MDTPDIKTIKPLVAIEDVRAQIRRLVNEAGSWDAARGDVLGFLKTQVKDARAQAQSRLEASGDGRACAQSLSDFQDQLICLCYDLLIEHAGIVSDKADAQDVEKIAIAATGGYGRGLLAPGSDIDLLFLLADKKSEAATRLSEGLLYFLWDLGFKVGHATRTIGECLKLATGDVTIRTSLLDTRLIRGNTDLFEDLMTRFREEVVKPTARAFIEAKMAERDSRHARSGDARYMVEPNIKDGKGGLRDLHTLHWLSQIIYDEEVGAATVRAGIFTEEEAATFHRCEDFLWTIRCYLHFLTGRAEERLTFDVQPQMAEWLSYSRHGGLLRVERFMKHYFLVAKDVGDLTSILCAALEMQQVKSAPGGLKALLGPMSWKKRREVRLRTQFRIDNDRINVASADAFESDPVNILRLFAQSAKTNTHLHPDAIRLLRQSLRLINSKVRADPEANLIFLDLLLNTADPAAILRRMNNAGILSRFIPAFRRVVGMMQFNMYHHYTVDEHLIRTVQMVTEIESGDATEEHPLASDLITTVPNRRVLYVAAFLHDIGKGRREDHSVVGARIARDLCPRLGMTPSETETVAWLIEEHLTMSNIAQTRDLSDPKTIRDFADTVQSMGRLKLLLILTVADIRAVGPGVWNGWKGQLIRTLYYEAETLLSGGQSKTPRSARVASAKEGLVQAMAGEDALSEAEVREIAERFYDDYWLKFETRQQVEHVKLIARAGKNDVKLAVDHTTDEFTEMTELTIYAPNHPRLLSLFAGACALTGGNIVAAQITSTRDGFALDTFRLQREFDNDSDEARRASRIQEKIERLLKGEGKLKKLLAERRPSEHRVEAFDVEPEIMIANDLSDQFTVIEVAGRDRPKLLYDLTNTLSDLSLDISSAHITTWGEKACDVFYVTDLTGRKITSEQKIEALEARMREILLDVEQVNVS